MAKRAFQALPKTVTEFYFRGDSACEEDGLLTWLRNDEREDGLRGRIGFAVSARMCPGLRTEILRIPEADWQPYSEDATATKEFRRGQQLVGLAGEETVFLASREGRIDRGHA